jgi:translocation and assembly module TamA
MILTKWCRPLILTFLSQLISFSYAAEELCPQIVLHGKIKFTETEKRLVCGDKELEAYRHIPTYQASFILKGFLQSRGYLRPNFIKEGDTLHVHKGKRSKVKDVTVISDDPALSKEVRKKLKRLYRKRILDTGTLNSIEAEAKALARQQGHPCVKIRSHVDINRDQVTVALEKLAVHVFGEIDQEEIEGVYPEALARYYPFDASMRFNEDLLRLTEKRMTRAEVVQGTYFLEECSEDLKEFSLSQRFITGPPRTLRFGAGASTEVGPLARAKWSHNRLGSMASILNATLQASLRSQSLSFSSDLFLWKHKPRRSLLSQVEIIRESQIDFEQSLLRLRPHVKWSFDDEKRQRIITLGPSYEGGQFFTKDKSQSRHFSTGIIEGSLHLMSHDYELFDFHPQAGDSVSFTFDYRHPGLGFTTEALKLDSTYARLSHLGNSDRGSIVAGVRVNAGTTWVADEVDPSSLPPSLKFYGGGSDDIRGFLLRTLPRSDGRGALSKLGLKLELRRTHVWKESLEAFSFLDSAYFGERSWSTSSQLFTSPGLGIRWLSPIGMVQTYLARGLSLHPSEDFGNFYFIGLGGVF